MLPCTMCVCLSLKDHLWDTAKVENKSHIEQFFAEVRIVKDIMGY